MTMLRSNPPETTNRTGRGLNVFMPRLSFVLSFLWLTMTAGCTSTTLFSKLTHKNHFPKATAADPAVRCLCLWDPAEGTGVDDKPARGVSGQIFFFTRNSVSAVEVDGDVRIFVFDDQGPGESQAQPLHEFDFVGGAWKTYLTSTQFGPAYQLFVPYSRKGRHHAELALRVRLTPPNGSAVYSDLTRIVLPGFDRAKAKAASESHESTPDEPDLHSVDETDTNVAVTPHQVEQTLRQILVERRDRSSGPDERRTRPRDRRESSEFLTAESSPDRPSQRQSELDPQDDDTGGEFQVSDEPDNSAEPPVRIKLRQTRHPVEEVDAEEEE